MPGKFHEQRSLEDYSYGVKESDMTERALVGFTTGKINALPIA